MLAQLARGQCTRLLTLHLTPILALLFIDKDFYGNN